MVFKIDAFFVSLNYEKPNKSVSEILDPLPLKTFSSMLRMLLRNIDLNLKKLGYEGGNEQQFQCLCYSNKFDLSNP